MPEVTYDNPYLPDGPLPMTCVHLPTVVMTNSLHPAIRGLAFNLTQKEYMNIGVFFKSLTDEEVEYFIKQFKLADVEYSEMKEEGREFDLKKMPATNQVALLCLLLGRCEGFTEIDYQVVLQAIPNVTTILFIEKMHRQKKLKANRINYSLSNSTKPVVLDKNIEQLKKLYKDQEN